MGVGIWFDGHECKAFKCSYGWFHYFRKVGIYATILWLQQKIKLLKEENAKMILSDNAKNVLNDDDFIQNNSKMEQIKEIISSLIDMLGKKPSGELNSEAMENILWIKIKYMIPLGISGICELCCRPDNDGYISIGQSIDILAWYSILSRTLLVDAIAMFLSQTNKEFVTFSEAEKSLLQESSIPPYEEKENGGCETNFNLAISYLHLFDTLHILLNEAVAKKQNLIVC
jgi:hypothetical protein